MKSSVSALLLASWQISTPALAQTAIDWESLFAIATTDGTGCIASHAAAQKEIISSESTASIDGLDCVTSYDVEDQLTTNAPDSPGESDENASVGADRAVIAPRHDVDSHPLLLTADDNLIVPPAPLFSIVLRFSIHCFYSVHEHIRERAPPCRAIALATADLHA